MTAAGKRRLILLRGGHEATSAQARDLVGALDDRRVLWAGGEFSSRRDVQRLLGRSFDAVVVSLHDGLDADLLGQCHGFIVGGGALIVCAPDEPPPQQNLAAAGFEAGAVTDHFWTRLIRRFADASTVAPVESPQFVSRGTADQLRVVAAIRDDFDVVVLTADRGRGKSAALGLAAGEIDGRLIVTAASEDAVREVFAFAPAAAQIEFVDPPRLVAAAPTAAVVFVDEAAQLPVGLLKELTERYPDTRLVFSTTTHGYEGTGRGFSLRFVDWLRRSPRHVTELQMRTPIRWSPGDPLERTIFDALLLDAEPNEPAESPDVVTHREVPRDELARDDALLREVFGLLVQAHYRTTPGDLHRLLDAPNLAVHASFADGHVVAATLVAQEGTLNEATCTALHDGSTRVIGHALPETFAAHLGYTDAAALRMVRSVRIATHPKLRRRGVAAGLVEHVHRSYDVDLFGTLFGATAGLLTFRRRVGYELVRLSASRGRRTGVPSVAMIRPVSGAARELFAHLRRDLARDLPVQLELFAADGVLRLDTALQDALRCGLDAPVPLRSQRRAEIVRHYAHGPRTFESAAVAVREFVAQLDLDRLDPNLRTVVEHRVVRGDSWMATAAAAQLSVPATMRAMRRAIRALVDT